MLLKETYPQEAISLLRKQSKRLVRKYFKVEETGEPFDMTDGQADIFSMVYYQLSPRCQVLTSTQYGKSTVIAFGVILRSQIACENFTILAGTKEKTDIIMGKVIHHLFDHPDLASQVIFDANDTAQKLKYRKNQEHITWKDGGSVRTITANVTSKKKVRHSLTGHGSKKIIQDESSLIPNEVQGMVMRMLGDIEDTFLLKIGNAVERNHFHRTQSSSKYLTMRIDYKQAIREGRYSDEYMDEMREEYNEEDFNLWYGCIFPPKDAFDNKGFRYVFDTDKYKFINKRKRHKGFLKMGVDVGRGGDASTITLRSRTFAETIFNEKIKDTMEFAKIVARYFREYQKTHNMTCENIFVDDTGVGGAVTDRLGELEDNHGNLIEVTPINNAQGAVNKERYANIRAENYMELEKWLRSGAEVLYDDQTIKDLGIMKQKTNSQEKIIMIPKDDLEWSPNNSDSLALTMNVTGDYEDLDIEFV